LRKQLELPPAVAKAFVRDMRAYFKAKDQNKRDEIAARDYHGYDATKACNVPVVAPLIPLIGFHVRSRCA
jgi:hypothetical protein